MSPIEKFSQIKSVLEINPAFGVRTNNVQMFFDDYDDGLDIIGLESTGMEMVSLKSSNYFQIITWFTWYEKTFIFRLKSQKPLQHLWVHLCLIPKANSSITTILGNQHPWNLDDCGKDVGRKSPSLQKGNDHTNKLTLRKPFKLSI